MAPVFDLKEILSFNKIAFKYYQACVHHDCFMFEKRGYCFIVNLERGDEYHCIFMELGEISLSRAAIKKTTIFQCQIS